MAVGIAPIKKLGEGDFAAETGGGVGLIGHIAPDKFDGDVFVKGAVVGFVDFAHAAGAEMPDDFEAAGEEFADFQAPAGGGEAGENVAERRIVDNRLTFARRVGQEAFDLLTKLLIIGAQFSEPLGLLVRR